jgi:hypothetical protein
MVAHFSAWWTSFQHSFHDSEVIVFARFQVVFGILWGILQVTDLAPLIDNPKYYTGWLMFSGFITEMLRRNRATDLNEPPPTVDDHLHVDKP